MTDSHDSSNRKAARSASELHLKKPLPDVTRIVGEDGELTFEVPGPRKRRTQDAPRLTTTRLLLMLIAVVLIMGGAAVGIRLLMQRDAALLNQQPNLAAIPKEFVGGPYQPSLSASTSATGQVPCAERVATVIVGGRKPVSVRVWTWSDQGSYDRTEALSSGSSRQITFHIPASAAEKFNVWVYDANQQAVSGVSDVTIGVSHIPVCAIVVDFEPFGG